MFSAMICQIVGVDLPVEGGVFTHYIGVSFSAVSLVCWLNRDASVNEQKNTTFTLTITDTFGFVVSFIAQLRGFPNAWGWVKMLLWFVLAAGNIDYRWFDQIVFESVKVT